MIIGIKRIDRVTFTQPRPWVSAKASARPRSKSAFQNRSGTLEVVPADERATEGKERLVDVVAALVADRQAAVAVQPGQRALHDPAVAAQALLGLDPLPRDPNLDVPTAQCPAATGDVVGLVGMELGGTLAPPPGRLLDGRDGVDQVREDDRLVAVGPGQARGERDAGAVDHKVALRARFAAIRRVGASGGAPLLAGTLAASRLARDQSILSASPRRSSSARWSRSQTPSRCQSRRRRQHVTPEP